MPLRDDLLTPIPGANPAGIDLRYDAVYDRIREARREDDDAPQGDWQRARKVADLALVTNLARVVGYEADAEGDSAKQEARQNAIAEGGLPAEEFDQGFDETPKSWYKESMA